MDVSKLLEDKRAKVSEANTIRDRVYSQQDGEWRGDDTAKFDGLMGEVEKISEQIERLAKLDAAERSLTDAEKTGERRSAPMQPSDAARGAGRQRGKVSVEDRALALHGGFAASSM